MICQTCGSQISDETSFCPNCGVPALQSQESQSTALQLPEETQLPMNWFRFLTRFGLWVGGIGMILIGCSVLLGVQHLLVGIDPSLLYMRNQALLIADFVYGAVCIGIGICCIITRFRLVRFHHSAPQLLYITHALLVLTPVIYTIFSGICIGEPLENLLTMQLFAQLIGLAAGIVLHVIYFKKRSHLFNEYT